MKQKLTLLYAIKVWKEAYIDNQNLDIIEKLRGLIGILLRYRLETKKYPEWYWRYGLHDAKIKAVNINTDKNHNNSVADIEITIDSSDTYSSDITTIKFVECRVMTGNMEITGNWWINDKIKKSLGGHVLIIETINEDKIRCKVKIGFKDAIVCRNEE